MDYIRHIFCTALYFLNVTSFPGSGPMFNPSSSHRDQLHRPSRFCLLRPTSRVLAPSMNSRLTYSTIFQSMGPRYHRSCVRDQAMHFRNLKLIPCRATFDQWGRGGNRVNSDVSSPCFLLIDQSKV